MGKEREAERRADSQTDGQTDKGRERGRQSQTNREGGREGGTEKLKKLKVFSLITNLSKDQQVYPQHHLEW